MKCSRKLLETYRLTFLEKRLSGWNSLATRKSLWDIDTVCWLVIQFQIWISNLQINDQNWLWIASCWWCLQQFKSTYYVKESKMVQYRLQKLGLKSISDSSGENSKLRETSSREASNRAEKMLEMLRLGSKSIERIQSKSKSSEKRGGRSLRVEWQCSDEASRGQKRFRIAASL